MKKPREFWIVILDPKGHYDYPTKMNPIAFERKYEALFYMSRRNKDELIKVQEITNEPRTTKAKAPRAKTKTSRPERAGSIGKATNKPRVQAVAGQGKAEVEKGRTKTNKK